MSSFPPFRTQAEANGAFQKHTKEEGKTTEQIFWLLKYIIEKFHSTINPAAKMTM